ncbi:unnamed protein product, partial [Closterium sp. NIES-53]
PLLRPLLLFQLVQIIHPVPLRIITLLTIKLVPITLVPTTLPLLTITLREVTSPPRLPHPTSIKLPFLNLPLLSPQRHPLFLPPCPTTHLPLLSPQRHPLFLPPCPTTHLPVLLLLTITIITTPNRISFPSNPHVTPLHLLLPHPLVLKPLVPPFPVLALLPLRPIPPHLLFPFL